MPTRFVPRALVVAALAAPLAVAAPASAGSSSYETCPSVTSNGTKRSVKVRHVTCPNAAAFLTKISTLKPGSVKQDGSYTVATVKPSGWSCTVRYRTPTAANSSTPPIVRGTCSASHKRAIRWVQTQA